MDSKIVGFRGFAWGFLEFLDQRSTFFLGSVDGFQDVESARLHDFGEDLEGLLEIHEIWEFALVVRDLTFASLVNLLHEFLLGLLDVGVVLEGLLNTSLESLFGSAVFGVDRILEFFDLLLQTC